MAVWSTIEVAYFWYVHMFPKNVQHLWQYEVLYWLHTFGTFIRSLKMCNIYGGMKRYSKGIFFYETRQKIFSLLGGKTEFEFWPLRQCKENNSYFYIEKWTFKIMCEVCYRAKRDKKEAT